MIPLDKLVKIEEFALYNGFDVSITSDNALALIFSMKIEYGNRVIEYRGHDGGIFVENIEFSGCFELFDAEFNILTVIKRIGDMLRGEVDQIGGEEKSKNLNG